MKSENDLTTSTTPAGDNNALSDQTKILVNMVFARLKAAYGHRFESTFGDSDSLNVAKREWAYCIQDYSEADLARALHECKLKHAWPPSIAEFVALMKPDPESYGLPGSRQAYLEACRCRQDPKTFGWTHPLIYHAAIMTGLWFLQNQPEKIALPIFSENYDTLVNQLKQGHSFTIPDQIQLEDQSDQTTFANIKDLSKQYSLEESELYYLTLIPGSDVRKRFRNQLIAKKPELDEILPV